MDRLIGAVVAAALLAACDRAPQEKPQVREYTAEEKAYMEGAAKLGSPPSASSGCNGPGKHRLVGVNGLIDKGIHDLGWLGGEDSLGKAEAGQIFEVGLCSKAEGLAWGVAKAERIARERGVKLIEPHVATWVVDGPVR